MMNYLRKIRYVSDLTSKFPRQYSTIESIEKTRSQSNDSDKLYKHIELELKGNDLNVLKSFGKFAITTGEHLNIETKSWNLKKPIHERFTVLKAAHVQKKHRVQYEYRTYFQFIQYKHLTGSTVETLLEYIQRNLPEGVAMKTTKIELQTIPDYLQPPKL